MNRHLPGSRLGQLYLGAVITRRGRALRCSQRRMSTRGKAGVTGWHSPCLTLLTGSFTVTFPGLLARTFRFRRLRLCLSSGIWAVCRNSNCRSRLASGDALDATRASVASALAFQRN